MISAMFATPRLPAVIATVWPGFTRCPDSAATAPRRPSAGICSTGSVGD